jgi:hypothetical protein
VVTEEVDCVAAEPQTGDATSVVINCAAEGLSQDVQCDSNTAFQIDANDLNANARVTITVTNTFAAVSPTPVVAAPIVTG